MADLDEQRQKNKTIEVEGKLFYPPEFDSKKDKLDGKGNCSGKDCKKSHYGTRCNVCSVSYGQHCGHRCPVGGTGNFQENMGETIKPAKRE